MSGSPWGEHWAQRQYALGVDFGGEWREPNEISSLERLQAIEPGIPLSQKIRWIPKSSKGAATSDFIWNARDGLLWEMKSPDLQILSRKDAKNQAKQIAKAISDDAGRGKKYFLIDIGNLPLTRDLRYHLSLYNKRRSAVPDYQISALIVMSNGQLFSISL